MNKIFQLLILILAFHWVGNAQLLDETEIYSSGSSSGSLCLKELYSSGDQRLCLDAPSSLSSDLTITFPSTLPAGSDECLQISSAGVISISGAACGGGGGSSLPVVDTTSIVEGSADDTKEVRIEADGITTGTVRVWTAPDANITVAGINLAQTWTANQTYSADIDPASSGINALGNSGARWDIFGDDANINALVINTSILPDTNEGADIGASGASGPRIDNFHVDDIFVDNDIAPRLDSTSQIGTGTSNRFLEGWFDDVQADNLLIQRPGQASHDFNITQESAGGVWVLEDSGGTNLVQFSVLTTPDRFIVAGDVIPTSGYTYDLGEPISFQWDNLYIDDIFVRTNVDITGNLIVDGTSQIGNSDSDHSTIYVGTSGNFYMRDTGGNATAVNCNPGPAVTDGWFAITADNYLVWCNGSGTRYRVAGASY